MDRRAFVASVGGAGALAAMTMMERADALEHAMSEELDRAIVKSGICTTYGREEGLTHAVESGGQKKPYMMGHDPRLPRMSDKPTLMEFFEKRFGSVNHMLQSAALAQKNGLPDKVVLACLLHDIGVGGLLRSDHGYWGAQLLEPYVDEEISWSIRYHQALRFFPDEAMGYTYPEAYVRFFGADYEPDEYIKQAHDYARNHKWYETARHITINDVYSFDPNARVELGQFADIIGRHFRQPKEGLGFDNSPSAHMWRTMIFPNNFL
jgi:predicted HD phosphohydrolase